MQRRDFLLRVASGVAVVPAAGFALADAALANPAHSPAAASPAALRIGQRILSTLPAPDLQMLRAIALPSPDTLPSPDAPSTPDLQARVAADHRAGRTLRVGGISLAQTEAAFCLAAAEGLALS